MGKYKAAYKCPLCGKLIVGNSTEIPYETLPELLSKFVRSQYFSSNPYIETPAPYVPHNCADGSAGLAPFAGFLKEK